MAAKDLSARVRGDYAGEHAAIKESLNLALENLTEVFATMTTAISQVNSAAREIGEVAEDMVQRGTQHLAEKRRIAERALELIEDGDTVILDTGTTCLELARLLHQRRDLTVVTNDLAIALCLEAAETVRVLFMGGLVRRNYHCTIVHGSTGGEILAGLSVDKAFMACNSFSVEKGASTPDIMQAETKKLMMSIAAKVILLFDASKMGRTSFALFAPLDSIETIVTDAVGAEDRARLEESGVEVLTAG